MKLQLLNHGTPWVRTDTNNLKCHQPTNILSTQTPSCCFPNPRPRHASLSCTRPITWYKTRLPIGWEVKQNNRSNVTPVTRKVSPKIVWTLRNFRDSNTWPVSKTSWVALPPYIQLRFRFQSKRKDIKIGKSLAIQAGRISDSNLLHGNRFKTLDSWLPCIRPPTPTYPLRHLSSLALTSTRTHVGDEFLPICPSVAPTRVNFEAKEK